MTSEIGICDACNEPGQLEHREASYGMDEGAFCPKCRQGATDREMDAAELYGGER